MAINIPSQDDILKYLKYHPEGANTTGYLRKELYVAGKNKTEFKQIIKNMIDQGLIKRLRDKRLVLTNGDTTNREGRRKQDRSSRVKDQIFEKKIFKGNLIQEGKDWTVVREDDKKVFRISDRRNLNKFAQKKESVMFEVYDHPKKSHREKLAKVVASLGAVDYTFSEVCDLFAKNKELTDRFSPNIIKEVKDLNEPNEKDFEGRLDLRDVYVVCIDPEGARDHDDAISIQELDNGNLCLGVHIADVSHFVTENSAIDEEALNRSFTQYLPWKAFPMLPEELSSGWCSLKENEDRLAFSCIMELTKDAEVVKYEFAKTIVRVDKSITYEEAFELQQKGDQDVCNLANMAQALRAQRQKEGVLELSTPEMKVAFDEITKEPMDIIARDPDLISYSWIEECMLIANNCCAKMLKGNQLLGVYRVHEAPDSADILELANAQPNLFKGAPYQLKDLEDSRAGDTNIQPEIFQLYIYLIKQANGEDEKIHKILRSMKKARYSKVPEGHYALNWQDYSHFTSPIRRYADLWTHRRISEYLSGVSYTESPWLDQITDQISGNEITIMKNERSALKICATWLIKDRVGEEFEGEVTGFLDMGLFVRINNPQVEGLVKFKDMAGDYFNLDLEKHIVRGKRSGIVFKNGTKVKVQLVKVDCVKGEVDFIMLGLVEKQRHSAELTEKL